MFNKILNISLVTIIIRKIRPLCIFFLEKSEYRIEFDTTACMSFLMKDEEYLAQYNEMLEKVSNIIIKEFNSEPTHNNKYLKAKKDFITKNTTQKKVLIVFICQQ